MAQTKAATAQAATETNNTETTSTGTPTPASAPAPTPVVKDANTETTSASAPAPAPVVKDERNGITRPKAGTVTCRIWEICDEESKAIADWAPRDKVIARAKVENINEATASTQYGRWRKYNGLVTVRIKPEVVPAAAADSDAPTVSNDDAPPTVSEGVGGCVNTDLAAPVPGEPEA